MELDVRKHRIQFTKSREPLFIKPLFDPAFNILKAQQSSASKKKKQRLRTAATVESTQTEILEYRHMNGNCSGSVVHLFSKRDPFSRSPLNIGGGLREGHFHNGTSLLRSPTESSISFVSGTYPSKMTPRLNSDAAATLSTLPRASLCGKKLVDYSDSESEGEVESDEGGHAIVRSRILSVHVNESPRSSNICGARASVAVSASPVKNLLSEDRREEADIADNIPLVTAADEKTLNGSATHADCVDPQSRPSSSGEKVVVGEISRSPKKEDSCLSPGKKLDVAVWKPSSLFSNGNNRETGQTNGGENHVYGPQLPPMSNGFNNDECLQRLEGKNDNIDKINGGQLPQTSRPPLPFSKSLIPPIILKRKAQEEKRKDGVNVSGFGIKRLEGPSEKKIVMNIPTNVKNGELRNGDASKLVKRPLVGCQSDGPARQRRRLLSERGEEERKHPIIDRAVISHWKWTPNNRIGSRKNGCGLLNSMNDCFLNSVLQIVTHTAPLAHFILSHRFDQSRCRGEFCIMCRLRKQLLESFSSSRPIFNQMVKCTKQFFKSHHRGQQADAHEALLHLLDAIDGVVLPGVKSKSTPSEQIFGMTLRYRGVCKKCGKDSNGYERVRVLELCMDKWRPTNVSELLQRFFRTENLNDYKCEKCNGRGFYSRTAQILRPPAVLILQIQRFSFMRKVKEEVFPTASVDLQPFLVERESTADQHGPAQYQLRGVIDHLGFTIDSGHYRAFHTDVTGEGWFEFDDEMVRRVDFNSVRRDVRNGCYLLIYHRKSHC